MKHRQGERYIDLYNCSPLDTPTPVCAADGPLDQRCPKDHTDWERVQYKVDSLVVVGKHKISIEVEGEGRHRSDTEATPERAC